MSVCGMYHCSGTLVYCVNATSAWQTCCIMAWCLAACSSLVVSVLVTVVEGRWRQGWRAHTCADLLCCAVFNPPTPTPPGFWEGLGVFFHVWEDLQTAELDKPRHFAVTSLGLTSGLGLVGQFWMTASHPFASPFLFATHVTHPNNRHVNPKLMWGCPSHVITTWQSL